MISSTSFIVSEAGKIVFRISFIASEVRNAAFHTSFIASDKSFTVKDISFTKECPKNCVNGLLPFNQIYFLLRVVTGSLFFNLIHFGFLILFKTLSQKEVALPL